MKETNAAPLIQENRPASYRALSEKEDRAPIQETPLETLKAPASTESTDGQESHERGTTLKNVGLFRQAAEHFEKAAKDPAYALKGFAQMGLSLKKSGKQEAAIAAVRRAPQVLSTSYPY